MPHQHSRHAAVPLQITRYRPSTRHLKRQQDLRFFGALLEAQYALDLPSGFPAPIRVVLVYSAAFVADLGGSNNQDFGAETSCSSQRNFNRGVIARLVNQAFGLENGGNFIGDRFLRRQRSH